MSYTNLATKLILNGKQSNGAYPNNSPLGDGFVFLKFAWTVKIVAGDEFGLDSAPSLVAKTCELPKWTIDTQIVNVYNHKTIVQTKLTYEPITISFYDQTGGAIEKLIWGYVKGQFDPTDGSKAASNTPVSIEIAMANLSEPGAAAKVYTLTNAYITDATHETLDYADSGPVLWTITVRYEDLATAEFDGTTPTKATGILPKPKPPVVPPPNPTPITNPPKQDAITNNEAPSSTYSDPYGTGDGAAIMAAAENAPVKAIAPKSWPTPKAKISSYGAPDENMYTDAMGNSVPGYSPSTGTPAKAIPALTSTGITAAAAAVQTADGVNPAWTAAKNDYLKKHPPMTSSSQSLRAATNNAETVARTQYPQYTNQTAVATANGGVRYTANTQAINNAQIQRENVAAVAKAKNTKGY